MGGSVGVSDLQKNYQADPEESGGRGEQGEGVFMYNQQYWPIATYHLLPILFHVIFYMMLSQLFDRPKSGVTQYIRVCKYKFPLPYFSSTKAFQIFIVQRHAPVYDRCNYIKVLGIRETSLYGIDILREMS
jgi:hypothetical protein